MNTQSIKHNIEIIANVGVLMGIILLAYEVNQGNQLLELQAEYTQYQGVFYDWEPIATVPQVSELIVRAMNRDSLSEAEQLQLEYMGMKTLKALEWEYIQYRNGNIERFPTGGIRLNWYEWPPLAAGWPKFRAGLGHPDFVAFMEENVISQLQGIP